MIKAQVVAHSKNIFGDEIATMVVTFPRIVLAEFNTHRMFSRNSASSRAVPFFKPEKTIDMVRKVKHNPFIPIAWQRDHSGMQGTEYIQDKQTIKYLEDQWLFARDCMVDVGMRLDSNDVTKQLTNRLIEPFMWHTAIVTSTHWKNFYELRCPQYEIFAGPENTNDCLAQGNTWSELMQSNNGIAGDFDTPSILERLGWNKGMAEIHISLLAEAMLDAYKNSTAKLLQPDEWHTPFGDRFDEARLGEDLYKLNKEATLINADDIHQAKVEIATARCARVSYINYEGTDDYVKDLKLFKQLKDSRHMSPFEHCAKSMSQKDYDNYMIIEDGKVEAGMCRNFKGFIQLRSYLD